MEPASSASKPAAAAASAAPKSWAAVARKGSDETAAVKEKEPQAASVSAVVPAPAVVSAAPPADAVEARPQATAAASPKLPAAPAESGEGGAAAASSDPPAAAPQPPACVAKEESPPAKPAKPAWGAKPAVVDGVGAAVAGAASGSWPTLSDAKKAKQAADEASDAFLLLQAGSQAQTASGKVRGQARRLRVRRIFGRLFRHTGPVSCCPCAPSLAHAPPCPARAGGQAWRRRNAGASTQPRRWRWWRGRQRKLWP